VAIDEVFLRVLWFFPANHHSNIAPYSSITTPLSVYDSCDQAAHYCSLDPELGASSLTWHLADLRVKVIFTLCDHR
jgi:hypothetical protein